VSRKRNTGIITTITETEDTIEDPFQAGLTALRRWSWVFDWDEEYGSGFTSGEFLLRSDGVLLRRSGGSSYDPGTNETTWMFTPWRIVKDWDGGIDACRVIRWLKGNHYDLAQPSPTPANSRRFKHSGKPERARYI
jgi:hypothetical protein